jgi:membrane-bound lytic murein transglycosylase D
MLGISISLLQADCLNDLSYLKECLAAHNDRYLDKANYRYTISGRRETRAMLTNFPKYENLIKQALSDEGIPSWLCYLPLAESRLRLTAVSSAGAEGLWQIMPATARSLGLRVNSKIDERLDVVKSSRAAAQYLKSLHLQFDDWLLALAAYNCGPGNVRKAQRRARAYFYHEISRYLPSQTRRYVPRVLTISHIAQSPDTYGLELDKSVLPLRVIEVSQSTSLRTLATYYRLSKSQLYKLNPTYLNGKIRLGEEVALVYLPPNEAAKDIIRLSPMVISQHIKPKVDHLPLWQQFSGAHKSIIGEKWWKMLLGEPEYV